MTARAIWKGYLEIGEPVCPVAPEEVAAAAPESGKLLRVEAFIDCPEPDTLSPDRPYYLIPAEKRAAPARKAG